MKRTHVTGTDCSNGRQTCCICHVHGWEPQCDLGKILDGMIEFERTMS